jgi:hypothetical protein
MTLTLFHLDNVIIKDKIMDIEKAKSSDNFFDRPGINHALNS